MAKLTLSDLSAFVSSYVDANKQAGDWSESVSSVTGLIDKIGKQVTIDGTFQDSLPELSGDDLPLGKTIEETFMDLTLPSAYDPDGANKGVPNRPTFEDAAYSYDLGRKIIKTTESYDTVERGSINAAFAANLTSKVLENFANSRSLYEYNLKKQLLGNYATKAVAANRYAEVTKPVDTLTAENFIKTLKIDKEAAGFASEGTSLSGALIGVAPKLIFYTLPGVKPVLEVDAEAGAFNGDKIAAPVEIRTVDSFGDAASDIWGILVDPRGVKLHTNYHAIRDGLNEDGDFINFVDHSGYTGFISKYAYVKVYKQPAE